MAVFIRLLLGTLFISLGVQSQSFNEILGRPTDTSITISILFSTDSEVYCEYGIKSGVLTDKSSILLAKSNEPFEISLQHLKPNTQYFYRTVYKSNGVNPVFQFGNEHSFFTQRRKGSVFSFAIEADPHLDSNTNPSAYQLTLQNMLLKKPDFMIDLGDNFMNDKLPTIDIASITNRNIQFRQYFSLLCQSAPLYLVLGNHEGEVGWNLKPNQNKLPEMAANIRKMYYPNPFPNGFYTGSNTPSNNVGLREDYYAWTWGDALFVVIDPYFYTHTKPGWGWTLGSEQYEWLKNTLRESKSTYKFIFSHQIVGGSGKEGRGGIEFAHLYEMGGSNLDSSWGFDNNRPGWEKPIHQLMVETNVNIFFHGHDHFYGMQEKDGVIYQEVPQPSAKNINNITGLEYGYRDGIFLSSRGYLLARVSPDSVNIDYIKTYLPNEERGTRINGETAFTYTLKPNKQSGKLQIIAPDIAQIIYDSIANNIYIVVKNDGLKYQTRIFNASGNEIYNGKDKDIDASGFAFGSYVVQVKTDKYVFSKTITIKK